MATGAGGHADEAIGAFFDRLLSELIVDHVMQANTAVGMNRVEHFGACA